MRRSDLEWIARRSPDREVVGIGLKFPWSKDYIWEQLENSAEPGVANRFVVKGEDLFDTLQKIKARLNLVSTTDVERVALWHSHPVSDGPSEMDIREFRGDVFCEGFVYHSPTGNTTRYNSTGLISEVHTPPSRTTAEV